MKCHSRWAGMASSIWRLATGWTVRGSNIGGGEIFRTRPDRSWGSPSLQYNGCKVIPGGKSGRDVALIAHPYLAPRLKKL